MSYELYGFTEDEIAAGLPGLMYGHSYDGDDDDDDILSRRHVSKEEILEQELRVVAAKLVAGLVKHEQIKNKIVKQLFRDQLKFMIAAYRKAEGLPIEYVLAAQQSNCLEILITDYLKKELNFELTDNLHDEIRTLVEEIRINDELEIVYDRVARIQAFLHKKIDDTQGMGGHYEVDIPPIKNLLSACRLHLNLADIKYKDVNSLVRLITDSETAASFEAHDPETASLRPVRLRPGAKFNRGYRVHHHHLRSLLYFAEPKINCKIYDISHLVHDEEIGQFRNRVIEIYCQPNYPRRSKYSWAKFA